MAGTSRSLRQFSTLMVFLVSFAAAGGAVESTSIPFPDAGQTMGGSAGLVVPLSSTSFLAGTGGIDGAQSTINNVTLLVTGLDRAQPTVVSLAQATPQSCET